MRMSSERTGGLRPSWWRQVLVACCGLAVSFAVARTTDVRATVLDLQGREVAVLADAPFAAGTHSLAWDGSRQAPGVYFVNVRRDGATTTSRILIAR